MYFWAYESDPAMARELAIGWVNSANRRQHYAPTVPTSCGVIYAEIAAPEIECLDCTTVLFEESVNEVLGKMQSIRDEDLEAAYQAVISRLEDKQQVRYRIVHARVAVPKGMPFVQKIFVGNPAIHVVRSGWEEIAVRQLEQVPLAA